MSGSHRAATTAPVRQVGARPLVAGVLVVVGIIVTIQCSLAATRINHASAALSDASVGAPSTATEYTTAIQDLTTARESLHHASAGIFGSVVNLALGHPGRNADQIMGAEIGGLQDSLRKLTDLCAAHLDEPACVSFFA